MAFNWTSLIGPAIGAIGGYFGGKEAGKANEAFSKPSYTTQSNAPWANVGSQLDESIRGYSDSVFNFTPSFYGAPLPQYGGGGGASGMQQGMNSLFGPQGFGGGLQNFISGNLGQGNQFMQDAYNQTSAFSPYRLDEMQGHLSGLAESPYMHQFLQSGGGTNPYEMLGLAGGFLGSQGIDPGSILQQFAPNFQSIAGMVGGFGGGGGGGGGGFDPGTLGDPTNQWMRDQLEGKYLFDESNPYAQQLADANARRISEQFSQLEVPQLSAQFSSAGRYGSPALYDTMLRSQEGAQQAISDSTSGIFADLYNQERGRMSDAVGMLNQLDQQRLSAAASAYGADASAGASRFGSQMGLMGDIYGTQANLLSNLYGTSSGLLGGLSSDLLAHDLGGSQIMGDTLLGYGNQRLQGGQMNLDAAMGATQADLAALEQLGGIAGMTGDYDLGLLGGGVDLVNSQMQGLGQIGSLRNQAAGGRYQAEMDRWRLGQQQHDYYRDAERQNMLEALGIFSGLGSQFGTTNTMQSGPPRQYIPGSPTSGALQGLIGGLMLQYGNGQGFNFGGGQQQNNASNFTNPYYGYNIGNPYGYLGGG